MPENQVVIPTKLSIITPDGLEIIAFPWHGPVINQPYFIKAFTGFDAQNIKTKFYGFGEMTKSKFYNMAPDKRVLGIRLGLNDSMLYSGDLESDMFGGQAVDRVAFLRYLLYRTISRSRTPLLDIVTTDDAGNRSGKFTGIVTKVESDFFTDEPEILIEFECEDPFFRSYYYETLEQFTADPPPVQILYVDESSTAPHGFKFELKFTGPTDYFEIRELKYDYNFVPTQVVDWRFRVTPGLNDGILGFQNEDVLHFSSEENDRYLYMVREGEVYHLLNAIDQNSIWPLIFPGFNGFEIEIASETPYYQFLTFEHKFCWWGG